jgi:hypothetical protein
LPNFDLVIAISQYASENQLTFFDPNVKINPTYPKTPHDMHPIQKINIFSNALKE